MIFAQATNPIIRWEYVIDEWDQIQTALIQHIQLTLIALVVGFAISSILVGFVLRFGWSKSPITGFTAFLYTIPSVALFGILVPYTGISTLTAEIALVSYTLMILLSSMLAGFDAVPDSVRDAADGMGMSPVRRVLTVELPLALPHIITGLRVAAVSTVGLVTVASIIGQGGLGRLILDGLRRAFWTPMTIGAALSVLLALSLDYLIYAVGRRLTPWERSRS